MRLAGPATVLAVLLSAACGTTVPLTSTTSPGSQLGGATVDGAGGPDASSLGTGSTGPGLGQGSGPTGPAGATSGGLPQAGTTGGGPVTTGGSAGGSTGAAASGGRVKTSLRLGVLTTDIRAAVGALGGSTGNSKKSDDGYRAVINALNVEGGLAGRRLVPTYQVVNALDSSYQSDAEQVCSAFKDAKVEVVLSDSASTDYGVAACLAKGGIPMITSVSSDAQTLASAPWVFNAFNPTYDSGYGAVVDRLVSSGYLTPRSRIGFVRISCPAIDAAYKNTVLPRMRAAHLAAPLEYTVSCASGFQDAGAYSAAMQSAVLKFRSQRVDRVFVMGSQENLLLQYFAEQAQNQAYHPGYALSSSSLPITLVGASTFPQQQLPQVHGVGWHPQGDANLDPKIPAERRCVALSTKGGLRPANISETYAVYTACANVLLLEAAVRTGNGSADGPALRATIPALGSSFSSTGIISGATRFGPGRQNGPTLANEWGYTSSCTCFRYLGKPRVMR